VDKLNESRDFDDDLENEIEKFYRENKDFIEIAESTNIVDNNTKPLFEDNSDFKDNNDII
jgi:hypothetical protein